MLASSGASLSLTPVAASCVACFLVGVVSACLPLSLLLLCSRLMGKGRGRGLGREGIENSLYSECKVTAESPVYEDIPPQFVNKTHFVCEENQAYGQAANCTL